jgi:hypothetical protein
MQLILVLLLSGVAIATDTGTKTKPLEPDLLQRQSKLDILKNSLLAFGTSLLAVFTIQGLKQIYTATFVNTYQKGTEVKEKVDKRFGRWPWVILVVGLACLVGWAVMSAMSSLVVILLVGGIGVGLFFMFRDKICAVFRIFGAVEAASAV